MPSFFFNDTATTEIYTLSLHDALPILILVAHLAKVVPFLRISGPLILDRFNRLFRRFLEGCRLRFYWRLFYWTFRRFLDRRRRVFGDRKSTRLNFSHPIISYAVFFF